MNKIILTGSYKLVGHNEGQSLTFNVGCKRDYKNKETGKYEYDNVTCHVPKFAEGLIKFITGYVGDGDTVELLGHMNTYVTEKDGKKEYHQDVTVDDLKILNKKAEEETSW